MFLIIKADRFIISSANYILIEIIELEERIVSWSEVFLKTVDNLLLFPIVTDNLETFFDEDLIFITTKFNSLVTVVFFLFNKKYFFVNLLVKILDEKSVIK
jgi:hypothetical protein